MAEMPQREHFAELIGGTVEAVAGDERVPLRVESVEDFGAADGVRFSVFLSGPGDRPLQQGIYRVGLPDGEAFELFIVPIGHEQDRYRYEAAFNREGA